MKNLITIITAVLLMASSASAQDSAVVYGKIFFEDNSLDYNDVNIIEVYSRIKAKPNRLGDYRITVPAGQRIRIIFDGIEDKDTLDLKGLRPGQQYFHDVRLSSSVVIKETVIRGKKEKTIIGRYDLMRTASVGGNLENIIGTLPGVSQTNELSSQYNVRGGNFDENLIYVNGMEVFRPQLVRAGQQEGLSFINPAMVSNIYFSAGGFEAKYGDKLSSVLDVTYKKPYKFGATIMTSFLGAEFQVEGTGRDLRSKSYQDSIKKANPEYLSPFRFVIGFRYRANGYILSSQDVQGQYNPRFFDLQSYLTYEFSKSSSISWLFNGASNQYVVQPQSQETSFGTATTALRLFVGFAGRDGLSYSSVSNSLKYNNDGDRLHYNFIASSFNIVETEEFDVEGAYRLSQLDNRLGSETFGEPIATLGTGYFINHGRNELVANIYNVAHRGTYERYNGDLEWGAKYQIEEIDDKYREWRYEDSAGFNISPIDTLPDQIILSSFVSSKNTLKSHRWMGYVQNTDTLTGYQDMVVTYGVRANYWSVNDQWVYSPRVQYSYQINKAHNDTIRFKSNYDSLKRKDITLRAAVGYYYQQPFYRELRDFEGNLNKSLKPQRSIHFVAGSDYEFTAWDRLFKFSSEFYYKKLDYMIPYLVDNVRIRYFADNTARGYATGADFRLNGEFIEGLESWMSMSFLKTDEKIGFIDSSGLNSESDFLRRPSDQRFSFSILFQDELKSDSSFKIHLNLVYGSNLPYYLNQEERLKEGFEIPAYRRVDVGFSKEYIYQDEKEVRVVGDSGMTTKYIPAKHRFAKPFKSVWLSLEVFNLLQINNTISYIWVRDLNNNRYGVPNFLTGRRLNLKLLLTI